MPPASPYPLLERGAGIYEEIRSDAAGLQNITNGAQNAYLGEQEEREEENDSGKKKPKKRRRVVVACDTCRRKKVKCEGLPNPSNTCNNCENMGYTCSFTVEPDRSRGRYEILESQKDTLLTALRSVAPELASQFERGDLHFTSPMGSKGENNGEAVRKENEKASISESKDQDDQFAHSVPDNSRTEHNPMVPDLEDGRPRYFGGSSTFGNISVLESRPTSPSSQNRRPLQESGSSTQATQPVHPLEAKRPRSSSVNAAKNNFSVLPSPMPQFPRNSIGWVRELRRKTLVAVGRDDVYASEGWFQRFHFPPPELLNELFNYYFQWLHPLLPILHEASLRRDLQNGRADRDSAFRGLIFTVLAISSRFHKDDPRVLADPKDPESAGDHWSSASRFYHQVYAASLINVQVLILSSAFMPASLGVGTSWTVLGAAIRAIFDIGLHTEKAYVGYTPFEQERRRRTFWAAFTLDSILCLNMGRPFGIRLEDCSVRYPLMCSEESLSEAERTGGKIEEMRIDDTTPSFTGGYFHLIKGGILIRQVIASIYQPAKIAGTYNGTASSPSYKDMTIMCKKIDEWIVEFPPYLQDVKTTPFPILCAFLQSGKTNLRLYTLKPFIYDVLATGLPSNDDSILRKMLLPQCANHARGTLRALRDLQQIRGISISYFFLHQSFLSASTFILTIWHGTNDKGTLLEDSDIIEFSLEVYNEQSRFASVLVQRAHRILRNIALRCLPLLTDDDRRRKMQELLRQSGVLGGGIAPATLNAIGQSGLDNGPRSASRHRSDTSAMEGGYQGRTVHSPLFSGPQAASVQSHNAQHAAYPANPAVPIGQQSTFKRPPSRTDSDRGRSSFSHVINGDHMGPQQHSPANGQYAHLWNRLSGGERSGGMGVNSHEISATSPHSSSPLRPQHAPSLDAIGGNTPINIEEFQPQLIDDLGTGMQGFQFNGDLSWTDYFDRFLGGLPDPSIGRSASVGGSPSNSTGMMNPFSSLNDR